MSGFDHRAAAAFRGAAMGFPEDYQLPAQRCHATQMLGNAIVPAVAAAAVRACMEAS